MTYVVTGVCAGCKCGTCAAMCPVGAFHESELMLVIDPNVCIDCDACRPNCIRGCIFAEEDVPETWEHYIAFNREESKLCPTITEPQEPLGFPNWECREKPWRNVNSVA